MAFLRYANASTIKPDINFSGWDEVRKHSNPFLERSASKIVFQEYNPSDYMLSHCTIIASVDTEQNGAPLGKHMVDGFQVHRKYSDWLITPKTSKYINNNHDAWEKKLLLACFRTFIGGENYVEHIQIPEMSRGKIIDAAARDIGDSIYVDILVATHRKHRELIGAITSGQLQTLSMGCQVEFTTCTRCGNVAHDETELCPHVRYAKGNEWIDEVGNKRKIAELCGHIEEEPGSVKFIEASWVANPAFTGAVLRNILSPREIAEVGNKIQLAFSMGNRVADLNAFQKAAYLLKIGEDTQAPPPAPQVSKEPEKDPFDQAVDDMANAIREKAMDRLRGELKKDENPTPNPDQNDTIIKSALQNPIWREMAKAVVSTVGGGKAARQVLLGLLLLKTGGWDAVKTSRMLSGREILALSRIVDLANKRTLMAGEGRIYRTILAVGGTDKYRDTAHFIEACSCALGRQPTEDEQRALIAKGKLYSLGS